MVCTENHQHWLSQLFIYDKTLITTFKQTLQLCNFTLALRRPQGRSPQLPQPQQQRARGAALQESTQFNRKMPTLNCVDYDQ